MSGERTRLTGLPGWISTLLLCIVFAAPLSCGKRDAGKRSGKAPEPKQGQVVEKQPAAPAPPLAGGTYGLISPEVLGSLARDPALKALRKRGILKAAAPCAREGLCMRMKYGAAVGFEVELIRKIANDALGVKENIVPADAADADVRMAVPCGSPGGPPAARPEASGNPLAGPYYYSLETGWLCMETAKGGRPLAAALDRILTHFYDTGTFQQVYKNWFPPEAPDLMGLR